MANFPQLNFSAVRSGVHQALRAWHQLDDPDTLLADLLIIKEQRRRLPELNPANLRLATNRVLLEAIELLEQQDAQAAQILKLRFMDGHIILQVGHRLELTEDEVKKRQHKAIVEVAKLIVSREEAVRQQQIFYLEAKLPPPTFSTLFGVADERQKIADLLLGADHTAAVALIGMGGLGKTSLANAVARDLLRHFYFEEIVWLHVNPISGDGQGGLASQPTLAALLEQLEQQLYARITADLRPAQRLSRIRQRLKTERCLIVIDNLEAELEPTFVAQLTDLASPSKFLLTSRPQVPRQVGVINHVMEPLNLEDVVAFIGYHAAEIGSEALGTHLTAAAPTIYEAVGGNPLALKLIVNLATFLPLAQILQDLSQADIGEIESLYRHIYWQTWHTLSQEGQTLLKVMPLAADSGSDPQQLQAMSGLNDKDLWRAISQLVKRSLLEVRGNTESRYYGIHRLTESFLKTEIIHWPTD